MKQPRCFHKTTTKTAVKTVAKTVALFLLLMLSLSLLAACGGDDRPTPAPEITREVLRKVESPDASLAYFMELRLPYEDASRGGFPGTPYTNGIDALLTDSALRETDEAPEKAPTVTELAERIGISRDEFCRAYGVTSPTVKVYGDVILYFLSVPEDAVYEGSPVAYAGRNVIVEDAGAIGTTVTVWSELELRDELGNFLSCPYVGRYGDRYHLGCGGYYDLTLHRVFPYESEKEFPPVTFCAETDPFRKGGFALFERNDALKALLRKDPDVAALFRELYPTWDNAAVDFIRYDTVGDRLHLIFGAFDEDYTVAENGEPLFDGGYFYRTVADTATAELLYVEKITLKNYYCDVYTVSLYALDAKGRYTAPYAK